LRSFPTFYRPQWSSASGMYFSRTGFPLDEAVSESQTMVLALGRRRPRLRIPMLSYWAIKVSVHWTRAYRNGCGRMDIVIVDKKIVDKKIVDKKSIEDEPDSVLLELVNANRKLLVLSWPCSLWLSLLLKISGIVVMSNVDASGSNPLNYWGNGSDLTQLSLLLMLGDIDGLNSFS